MQFQLLKALLILIPALWLLGASIVLYFRHKTGGYFLQLFGAACLVIMVLTHVCEALHVFPSMQWGHEHSAGHYLDLLAAVLGFICLPAGYLLQTLSVRKDA